jgi:hypothetical protein
MTKNKSTSAKNTGVRKPNIKRKSAARRETKIGIVIKLLQRKQGASVKELASATDWQPHTARSVLSRTMPQKGFTVTSVESKDGQPRMYKAVRKGGHR